MLPQPMPFGLPVASPVVGQGADAQTALADAADRLDHPGPRDTGLRDVRHQALAVDLDAAGATVALEGDQERFERQLAALQP